MKKSILMMFVVLTMILAAVPVQADPPPSNCKMKVHNCMTDGGTWNDYDGLIVHIYDADDGAHVWAAYENAPVDPGEHADGWCNHKDCDIAIAIDHKGSGQDIFKWKNNYCGDVSVRSATMPDGKSGPYIEVGALCTTTRREP
jgi:hypothetical protein